MGAPGIVIAAVLVTVPSGPMTTSVWASALTVWTSQVPYLPWVTWNGTPPVALAAAAMASVIGLAF